MSGIILGVHAIEELLRGRQVEGTLMLARKGSKTENLAELARQKGLSVTFASVSKLDALAGSGRHRGAIFLPSADLPSISQSLKHFLSRPDRTNRLVLLLDEITDPHNLGAILRSADQFSVDLVIIPQSHSVQLTGSVAKVSSGASAWVVTCPVSNLLNAMEQLKKAGYWLYGADKEGERANTVDLAGNIGIVMGSEGKGLRRLVRASCDGFIRIPSSGHVDSFNVSVAAGILMYEVRRQQDYYPAD